MFKITKTGMRIYYMINLPKISDETLNYKNLRISDGTLNYKKFYRRSKTTEKMKKRLKESKYSFVDLLSLQSEMKRMGIIKNNLTLSQIEAILENPFIKYRYLFQDQNFSLTDEEHSEYKKEFIGKHID